MAEKYSKGYIRSLDYFQTYTLTTDALNGDETTFKITKVLGGYIFESIDGKIAVCSTFVPFEKVNEEQF